MSFSQYLQENLMSLLVFDKERAKIIRNTVEPQLFGGFLKEIVSRTYDYIDRYGKPPGEHIADLLEDKLTSVNRREVNTYKDIISSLAESSEGVNAEYVMSQLEAFVKRQSLRSVAVELSKALQRDTEQSLEEAEALIRKATSESIKVFDPGLRMSDTENVLSFLRNENQAYPTGIPEFDKRGFGPTRGEMFLYIADTKTGKCICEGEPVQLANGSYIPVEQFKDGSKVVTLDEATNKFGKAPAILSSNGKKPVYKVVTKSGRVVRLTKNHPLLTLQGWKPLGELNVGDLIAAPFKSAMFGSRARPKHKMRFLGYMIADGGMSKAFTPTFAKQDANMCADMFGILSKFNCTMVEAKSAKDNYYIVGEADAKGNQANEFLRKHNLTEKKSNQKEIPNYVFRSDKGSVREFLRALFTCDGSIYDGRTGATFEYSTTSETLAFQINHLLTRFGLLAKVRERHQTVNDEDYVSWSILISDKNQIIRFNKRIGLLFEKGKRLRKLIKKHGSSNRFSYLCQNKTSDVFYDKIESIEYIGERETYDLSVPGTHNFICNNMVVHNTWIMIHLAKIALMSNLKVVHISLEMSEKKIAQRYVQTFFGISKRKEEFVTRRFKLDKRGKLDFKIKEITPKLSLDHPNIEKKLRRKLKRWEDRILDNIYVKQFPTGKLTTNELEAYLDNLEATQKFVPDLLIVDYPDLMKIPNVGGQMRHGLGEVYKNLRGIAVARNCALATPTQSNRAGAGAKTVGRTNVSEAYTKVADADSVITYSQTESEKKLGLARLKVVAGRNDADDITVVVSQNYGMGQFVIDSVLMDQDYFKLIEAEDPDDDFEMDDEGDDDE